MSHCVHLHVCFACNKNEPVAEIAKKHLPTIAEDQREARWFLEALAGRTGNNFGPKGGLSLWGLIANYVDEKEFVLTLRPFFQDLLRANLETGPCSFERILVFAQHEQARFAKAIELYLEDDQNLDAMLHARIHECQFSWEQM